MKTYLFFVAGALAVALVLPARTWASPGGFSGRLTAYRSYAADGISELHLDTVPHGGPRKWSLGGYAENQNRRVELDSRRGQSVRWDAETVMMTLGYDVLPQVTLLAGLGSSELTVDRLEYGSSFVWLGAARVRILDFMVFDPVKLSDFYWCRLDAVAHYQASTAKRGVRQLDWNELRASLTVSFVSRPIRLGSVDALGFYFGPVYSKLDGRERMFRVRDRMEGEDNIGIVSGVFVNPSRNTLMKLEVNHFERSSINLSAGFHF